MTSDTKIGLLLGLTFIFIAAFVINGLPGLRDNANSNLLTTNLVNSQNNPPGIGASERKISRQVINEEVRFRTRLSDNSVSSKKSSRAAALVPVGPSSVNEEQLVGKAKFDKPALSKFYIVREGESLTAIAVKFYGRESGNKKINVRRIFDANRKFLKSIDRIYVGQKLIIPPSPGNSRAISISSVQHTSTSTYPAAAYSSGYGRNGQSKIYVVCPDDSLWKIASEQLGDAGRYREIAELNARILRDEDCLFAGMRLKIPPR